MYLSGTFGELRSGHLHSGIDIKTKEQTGMPIYAIYDGYISRIKVLPNGYGKTLYIKHPNGYTSVYAHLSRFSSNIQSYVKSRQYINKRYALNIYPKAEQFQIKKGEKIALSGNTGSSSAPPSTL